MACSTIFSSAAPFNQGVVRRYDRRRRRYHRDLYKSPDHFVAIDAGRSMTASVHVDCMSLGCVHGTERFYDEGGFLAQNVTPSGAVWSPTSRGKSATRSSTVKPLDSLCRPFPGAQPYHRGTGRQLGLDGERLSRTIASYNAACTPRPVRPPVLITALPRPDAAKNPLGAAHRYRRLIMVMPCVRDHLHLPRAVRHQEIQHAAVHFAGSRAATCLSPAK